MLFACNNDENQHFENSNTNLAYTSNMLFGQSVRTDLAFITQQLITSYITSNNSNNSLLTQKIELLDSASLSVPLFISLKPLNFLLPTTTEAEVYLNHFENSYENLNVSAQMLEYLNAIVLAENVNHEVLMNSVQEDVLLNMTEKMQLEFILTYLHENSGGPIDDDSWSKKNIVAAVKGFEKSNANAVFNVSLIKITYQ